MFFAMANKIETMKENCGSFKPKEWKSVNIGKVAQSGLILHGMTAIE